jgi:RNA polymerase sigma-70 factor, ECF subfamily
VGREDRDTDEVELLYQQHGAALLLFASAMSGDRGRAQDVVHQVFLNLIENGNVGKAIDKKAYLFACVRNAMLNDSKRRRRDTLLEPDSIWFNPPDRDYVEERNLGHALKGLPDDQREVIVLHVWGELTFSAIGELVGISANTAASRYRYALAKLRQLMFHKEGSCANSR